MVTAVPLLVIRRVSFPAWLWLSGQWASGTFALLVITVGLAYTAAALVAGWSALRSAPSALTVIV